MLMSLRQSCETKGYDVGVGETDEEIGSFVSRLHPVCVIIDNWSDPLLVAHLGGYLSQAQDFYRLLFPLDLLTTFKFVVMTMLHLEVPGTILEG